LAGITYSLQALCSKSLAAAQFKAFRETQRNIHPSHAFCLLLMSQVKGEAL